MGPFFAFTMLASLASGGDQPVPAFTPTRAVASAQVSVRILPGAKVSMDGTAETEGYKLTRATVTIEDGTRRSAQLVEFQ